MMKTETKIESGDWGSLVMVRNVYGHGINPTQWKMATERREPWSGCYNVHPDSLLTGNMDCSQNPIDIVCPYCNDVYDPCEAHDWDGGEHQCYECEKTFYVTADFGYGFSTKPLECKHHIMVFESQYAYFTDDNEWTTWRNLKCINCNHAIYHTARPSKGQKVHTLLPWLDEYNDPDFFDPEGVLKTGADLTEEYETPILDFLREGYWGKSYGPNNPTRAINAHEKIYGDL